MSEKSIEIWKLLLMGHPITQKWKEGIILEEMSNGLSFRVTGEKYKGKIELIIDAEAYKIGIYINNGTDRELIETIDLNQVYRPEEIPGWNADEATLEQIRRDYGF